MLWCGLEAKIKTLSRSRVRWESKPTIEAFTFLLFLFLYIVLPVIHHPCPSVLFYEETISPGTIYCQNNNADRFIMLTFVCSYLFIHNPIPDNQYSADLE